ncbi:DUF7344 domain-containing protein [Natronoglomus mannanivorans]|uniref:DUF7344 domain-containing protein n=1 Tax=Natronoglomus mannanivorans TaxID=2979990 RepID=A0AAP2YXF9_9EURY|nr:hypothetical protein [Halobacteria archaeon AArc-xg1-1]
MPGDVPGPDDQTGSDTTWESHPTDQSPELTLTQIFTALANHRRRVMFECFRQYDDSVERSNLVDYVVTSESDSGTSDEEKEKEEEELHEQVAMDIHHNHLPRLTEMGLVEYDDRSTTIRYYGHPLLEAILEATTEAETEADQEPER